MNLKIISFGIVTILILVSCSSQEVVVSEAQVKKDLCPNCNQYELFSEYIFSDTQETEGYYYCRICDAKSPTIYRSYVYSQRCSGNCGYEVSEDSFQRGVTCPEHGDIWPTQLKSQTDYHTNGRLLSFAYACPSCDIAKIVYGTRYSAISPNGNAYCPKCDKSGTIIGRTVAEYERCAQSCGFSRGTLTRTQHGTRCSDHGDVWY